MCSCGCNTCETKTRGPLLTEGKVKSLLSEGLQYHIDKKIPLFETVYRIGSDKHLALIKEARKMYSRNVIDLCEEDEALIKTHLGEFGIYEGESVPLDLPMLNEEVNNSDLDNAIYRLENVYKYLDIEYKETRRGEKYIQINYIPVTSPQSQNPEWVNVRYNNDEDLEVIKKRLGLSMLDEAEFKGKEEIEDIHLEDYPEELVTKLKIEVMDDWGVNDDDLEEDDSLEDDLNREVEYKISQMKLKEAEFKGKDVPLNKPKRGGSKAYYVYVRDPKTKKIKKVSFGSGGLRAKIKNKEARNAFAARHRCKDKKDRTKAGYWSCNLPRYASALGLGANMNTFW